MALFFVMATPPGNFGVSRSWAQERGKFDSSSPRLLLGQVTDRRNQPIANAIVYLKNTKTLMVKTCIAAVDGRYRFPALSPNVEYQVYAEHQGKRSKVKTLTRSTAAERRAST